MRTIIPKDALLVPEYATRVFKGVIFDVYHWQQQMFDGSTATFERLKRDDTVKVIVIKNNKIIAIQEEQPTRSPALGLPGGRHDIANEDELAAAKRELHEETGMVCANWKLIAAYQPVRKIEGFVYIFLATTVLRQDQPHLDGGERIKVLELTFDQALTKGRKAPQGYFSLELLEHAGSVEGLLNLPDISKDDTKVICLNKP